MKAVELKQQAVKRKPKEARMIDCIKNTAVLIHFLKLRSGAVRKRKLYWDDDELYNSLSRQISYYNRQILYMLGISEGHDLAEEQQ